MNGYGTSATDKLYQQVAIPSGVSAATLTFWMQIDSGETGTAKNDTLKVQVRNSANAVLKTLATYSNLDAAKGLYQQRTFDLTAYAGQTIRVYFLGKENATLQTSFVLDDVALTAT